MFFFYLFTKASKGTVFQKIFDEQLRGHPEKVLGNPSDIVQSIVKAPKTVYYGSILDVMEVDHKQQLRTISIEEGYWLNQYFLCLPKDSELRDVFSYHMNKMKESGLVARLYRKWFPSLFKVEFVESTGDSSPISMVGVSYVYLIFGTICFFSILICFMECALKKIKK